MQVHIICIILREPSDELRRNVKSIELQHGCSYRETSSPEVPVHTLGPAQIISPQQLSNSPATKMQKLRVQNGNFCSAFPISAGLKPPNAQQQGLQLSRTKNKQTHQKNLTSPSSQKKTQSFTQQRKFSLMPHCIHYIASRHFPPSPLRQKKNHKQTNQKNHTNSAF